MKTIITKAAEAIYQETSEEKIRSGALNRFLVILENESKTKEVTMTTDEWEAYDTYGIIPLGDVITDNLMELIEEYLLSNNLL